MTLLNPVDQSSGFVEVFECLLDRLAGPKPETAIALRLGSALDNQRVDSFALEVRRSLLSIVEFAAIRCLLLEFHDYRESAGLDLDPGQNVAFESFLADNQPLDLADRLETRFPVLADRLGRALEYRVDAWLEFADHLVAELPTLRRERYCGPGARLSEAFSGAGDAHNGGRTVIVCHMNDGTRLYYKPRNLGSDNFARTALAALTPHLRLDLTGCVPDSLDFGSHGWQQERPKRAVAKDELAGDYFYRYGALCALTSSLGSLDLHWENIIPVQGKPVIVDTETLLRPPLGWPTSDLHDALGAAIGLSVGATMMLPMASPSSPIDVMMSALGARTVQRSAQRAPVIVDPFTDAMRMEWRNIHIDTGVSLPTNDAGVISVFDHLDELGAGFTDAMGGIRAGALDKVLKDGDDFFVRYVFRPTFAYGRFIDASWHPKYLASYDEFERFLELLPPLAILDEGLKGRVVEMERDSIACGDVPCFGGWSRSGHIESGGRTIHDAFGSTPFEEAVACVDFASARDDAQHLVMMEHCLAEVRSDYDDAITNPATLLRLNHKANSSDWWRQIGDHFARTLVTDGNDGSSGWWVGDSAEPQQTMGSYEQIGFHDLGGVVTFLDRCAEADPRSFADLAAVADRGFDEVLNISRRAGDPLTGHPLLGAPMSPFTGAASVLLSRARLAPFWLEQALASLAGDRPADQRDLATGAGGLTLLLAGDPSLFRAVAPAVRSLLFNAITADEAAISSEPRRWYDLAHGWLGIKWSQSRLAAQMGNQTRCRSIASEVAAALKDGPLPESRGWCNGAAGLLLAASEIAGHAGDEDLLEALHDGSLVSVAMAPYPDGIPIDFSVCHGASGVVQSLLGASRWREGDLQKEVLVFYEQARSQGKRDGIRTGQLTDSSTPGYWLGWAGIGDTSLIVDRIGHGCVLPTLPVEVRSNNSATMSGVS